MMTSADTLAAAAMKVREAIMLAESLSRCDDDRHTVRRGLDGLSALVTALDAALDVATERSLPHDT